MTEPTRELTQADADKLAETILQLPREQFFRKEIRAIIWQAAREAPPATGEDIVQPALNALSVESLRDLQGKIAARISELECGKNFGLPEPPKEGKP